MVNDREQLDTNVNLSNKKVILGIAKGHAARGWSIIPIGNNKKPACRSWKKFQDVRPTATELERLFSGKNIQGLAVICGPVSGNLVCRDFDEANAYHAWAQEHPDLAKTLPTVRTGRGFHVYFRSACHTRIQKLSDGEIRGGGYCLLPPSRHPSGATYEWTVPLPDGDIFEVDPSEVGLDSVREGGIQKKTEEDGREQKNGFGSLSSLLSSSVTPALKSRIDEAIVATLPTRVKQRETYFFKFARYLKAIPEIASCQRLDSVKLSRIGTCVLCQ